MRISIDKCDRCGKSATTKSERDEFDLKKVAIGVYNVYGSSGDTFRATDATHIVEYCTNCRTDLGLYFKPKDETAKIPAPTLEDLLREIISEEVRNQLPNQ